ncbi:MAG: hypothetical protein HYY46_04485 [Deltaproteobacteria bacterium]|nr:hypothetical protein [Deltaproteobacteria bacterium]
MTTVTFADLTYTGVLVDANDIPLAVGYIATGTTDGRSWNPPRRVRGGVLTDVAGIAAVLDQRVRPRLRKRVGLAGNLMTV